MMEIENQINQEKPKGVFGEVETVKNYYGLHLNLNTDKMKKQRDETKADNKVDVLLVIDGTRVEMTFDEFKSRLLTNIKVGTFGR